MTHSDTGLPGSATGLHVLGRVSAEINSTLKLDDLLSVVLRQMDALFGFNQSGIYLINGGGDALTLQATHGETRAQIGASIAMGSGIVGGVADKRQPMRMSAVTAPPVDGQAQVDSQMAIPMLVQDTLVGVFSVERHTTAFRKSDEDLASVIANQAAVAILNARAHEALREINRKLEGLVEDRTRDLQASNHQLRDTQAQLVQSGKMAALGQLAAGVAHEMNTPLGAITSNADVAQRAIQLIEERLEGQLEPGDKLHKALKVLLDTNRVTQDATARIFKIVDTLRSFAKLDEAALQTVDLTEGIESALTLTESLLRDGVQVIRKYAPMPPVRCYASEINQVFMILLTNAAEAVGDGGTITVNTGLQDDHVFVEVADDGCGIAEEHLVRVFDPGFTLKGVGVGTGLGLAIAFRIVEKHGGTIGVDSVVDRGATFRIQLPQSGPPGAERA